VTVARAGVAVEATRPEPARDLAPVSLVDLLDRLLGTGVVVAGDVVITLAGIDLVEIRLHLLVTSVRAEMARERERARELASGTSSASASAPSGGGDRP
jgi:hypothetical protein